MIAVGNEADVLALYLVRDDREAERPRAFARFGLRHLADRQKHAPNDRAVYPPEEVALVLGRVPTAQQLTRSRARVVTGRDPLGFQRVGLAEQIAELRERVASHARDRR